MVDAEIISIRLRKKDVKEARKAAAASMQPYQAVIRAWVAEKADALRAAR
jgi:hypothetical protein